MTNVQVKAMTEAKARIIWGEPYDHVSSWLQGFGLSAHECQTALQDALSERARTMRARGTRNCIIGLLLGGIGTIGIVTITQESAIRGASRSVGVSIVALFVGIWCVCTGIDRLISGARAKGSLAEM